MKKIAFVVHQYGEEIVGGAEGYTKDLAEHLNSSYDVSVFTTTSIDYNTWAPYYDEGIININGVKVNRYNVANQRNMKEFGTICDKVGTNIHNGVSNSEEDENSWIDSEGPYCPEMICDIQNRQHEFDLIVVVTYIYYLAVKIIPIAPEKILFISTAHDEPWINMNIFREIFNMPRYFGFLTDAERDLVRSKFSNFHIPCEILGTGINIETEMDYKRFKEKFKINGDYIIYVGRLDASKGCEELCNNFIAYKKIYPSDLKLVFVGKGTMKLPDSTDIFATGFVTEEEKYDAISGAIAMVTPSPYESLCIALLEGMLIGVPVIANAKCQVLKQHCIRSNGGLYYENLEEFIAILNLIKQKNYIYPIMQKNAIDYVKTNYSWNAVITKIEKIIDNIKEDKNYDSFTIPEECKIVIENDILIKPVYENAITIVTAADNSYGEYAGITINSILSNRNMTQEYDILVFTNDMSDENIKKILEVYQNEDLISIRFVYVNGIMDKLDIKISNNYKIVTYYRLLLQHLMKNYSKVLYMDSDVIVNSDVYELWNTELGCNLLCGTFDPLIAAWQNYDSGMQSYFEAINVNNPGKYLQAGVLLINIEELNNTFEEFYLLNQACNSYYIFADQDLLNIACKNRIKYVDLKWDVLNLSDNGRKLCLEYLPLSLKKEFQLAEENPCIIHFVEQSFPFLKNDRKYGELYWKYTYNSVYYMHIIEKMRAREDLQFENEICNILQCNLVNNLKINDIEVININNKIILNNGDILSGTNSFMNRGKHEIILKIGKSCKNSSIILFSGARHIKIIESKLKRGYNKIEFTLDKNHTNFELVIKNSEKYKIIVKNLMLT